MRDAIAFPPARLSASATLLVADVQQGFDAPVWGARNNPDAERQVARLLTAWRAAGRPVAHVQPASRDAASPLHPDAPGHAIEAAAAPAAGEPVSPSTGTCVGAARTRSC
jgi:nicotinamidase-related amidase